MDFAVAEFISETFIEDAMRRVTAAPRFGSLRFEAGKIMFCVWWKKIKKQTRRSAVLTVGETRRSGWGSITLRHRYRHTSFPSLVFGDGGPMSKQCEYPAAERYGTPRVQVISRISLKKSLIWEPKSKPECS